MGFSDGTVHHLTRLGRNGHLRPGARVLDFGSQNVYGQITEEAGRALFAAFDRDSHYHPEHFTTASKVEGLMAALGFDYLAFDLYTKGRTQKFDFNFDRLSFWQRGRFDLVMNLGTSEHVANQFNLFKTAHDALKIGGVMYNCNPFYGGSDHGLFNYHPKFFTSLITNNNYLPLEFDLSGIFDSQHWDEYKNVSAAPGGEQWEGYRTGMALMNAIFKKQRNARFSPPTDGVLKGDIPVSVPSVNEISLEIVR